MIRQPRPLDSYELDIVRSLPPAFEAWRANTPLPTPSHRERFIAAAEAQKGES